MMLKNSTKILLILLVIVFVGVGGLIVYDQFYRQKDSSDATTAKEKEKVIIGTTSISGGIYPNCAPDSGELAFNSNVFEPLVTFNRDNKIMPVLAIKWDNPDDNTWRFYLSPNAKFSNGTKVTAEDVKFTYDYILKDTSLPVVPLLPQATISVIDEETVEFKTQAPDPLLLNRLAVGFLVMSKIEVEANGLKNNIGSGPYLLSEYSEQQKILQRNENYWSTLPKVKTVVYKLYQGDNKTENLLNGEVDFIVYGFSKSDPDYDRVAAAVAEKKIQSNKVLSPMMVYLDLDALREKTPYVNTEKNPFLDTRVRKAIYQAIDINSVTEETNGVKLSQMAYAGLFGYDPTIQRPAFDVNAGLSLMKEAGYENGFEMTIDHTPSPELEPFYIMIAEQLKKINITVKMASEEPDKFFEKVASKDTSAYILGFNADTKDVSEVLDGLLHTPTGAYGQYSLGYSNPEVDKLIEACSQTLNQQIRQQRIQAAMEAGMTDVAKIPLFQIYINYAYDNDISWSPRLDGLVKPTEMAGK
ncbi:MAG: ABC transporter substrate-binding protein [Patescibacteria group bacterium]